MSSFAVVLDACVLVPASLCDLLLRSAQRGLYRLYWTNDILEEVRRTLVTDLGKSEQQADRRIEAMHDAFPDALVAHHTLLIDAMTNHPKDRHVLAAAVASGAQVIVTSNLSDFPEQALVPFTIEAQAPDEFLTHLFTLDPAAMIDLISRQAQALRTPPMTIDNVLDALAKHAPRFAALVRAAHHGQA